MALAGQQRPRGRQSPQSFWGDARGAAGKERSSSCVIPPVVRRCWLMSCQVARAPGTFPRPHRKVFSTSVTSRTRGAGALVLGCGGRAHCSPPVGLPARSALHRQLPPAGFAALAAPSRRCGDKPPRLHHTHAHTGGVSPHQPFSRWEFSGETRDVSMVQTGVTQPVFRLFLNDARQSKAGSGIPKMLKQKNKSPKLQHVP